jgi:hypothetical protein
VNPVPLELSLVVHPPLSRMAMSFVAHGTLRNRGPDPVSVNWTLLAAASLALEVRDASGQAVRLPPPPVPGLAAEFSALLPGQICPVEWRAFLPDCSAPGPYQVRFRCFAAPTDPPTPPGWGSTPVTSAWVDFELASSR